MANRGRPRKPLIEVAIITNGEKKRLLLTKNEIEAQRLYARHVMEGYGFARVFIDGRMLTINEADEWVPAKMRNEFYRNRTSNENRTVIAMRMTGSAYAEYCS